MKTPQELAFEGSGDILITIKQGGFTTVGAVTEALQRCSKLPKGKTKEEHMAGLVAEEAYIAYKDLFAFNTPHYFLWKFRV